MNPFDELVEEVKERFLDVRKSHDWDHTWRVLNLCLHIGEKEGADLEILKLAALLHDIGREEQDINNGKVCHAQRGGEIARELLEKHGYSPEIMERVAHCIETHRFRGDKKPRSKEARVLYDADKLDAIGAIGIGRAFVFAGEVGARVHNKGVDLGKTRSYSREDTAYREFMVKLRQVKDRMLTEEGKRIARDRHRYMVDFFDRLNREVEGEI